MHDRMLKKLLALVYAKLKRIPTEISHTWGPKGLLTLLYEGGCDTRPRS
jgi:hypothetical protein